MEEEKCMHSWEMADVTYGFIIMQKCSHCRKLSNYFTTELKPPMERYRENEHFWNYMDSSQSIRFNLKCSKCNKKVDFQELLGLMMCTGCDDKCDVNTLMVELAKEKTWIYVAFGYLPLEEKKQLTKEKIEILEDYFNQRRKSSKSKIKIVTQELVRDLTNCYGEVIMDSDMLTLTTGE